MVFVHGGFASLGRTLYDPEDYGWTWQWEFAEHFDFVTHDRRGCRLSSRPDGGYEIENQSRDLELLLDHLQVDTAHLIGSSAGGPIATLFAAARPGRVRSLVLVGTALV